MSALKPLALGILVWAASGSVIRADPITVAEQFQLGGLFRRSERQWRRLFRSRQHACRPLRSPRWSANLHSLSR